jgi:hypothetical protein
VTLLYLTSPSSPCGDGKGFFRVWADGSRADVEYKVPQGKFLFVTDVVWNATGNPSAFSEGGLVSFSLNARKPDGTLIGQLYKAKPVFPTESMASRSLVGGDDEIIAGVRVGPWRYLCPAATTEFSSGSATNTVKRAWLFGYEIAK